jgi:hypothetical protein
MIDKFTNPPAIVREDNSLAQLAGEIKAAHALAESTLRQGLDHYRRVGDLLRKAKERCGHGKFLPWLQANFTFSRQQAANLMRLAENWGKCKGALHLTAALRMLAEEKALRFHPLTEVKPRMDQRMFRRLKQSILRVGLLQPILVHKGMILDGRDRYDACRELGIEPEFTELDGERTEEQIARIIIAANCTHEPLKPAERAALLAELTKRGLIEPSEDGDSDAG